MAVRARSLRAPKKKAVVKENTMPSHHDQLPNLARIEGQIRGIAKMIEDRRYCLDILNQCRSVHAALLGVEKKIFRKFLDTCVRDAFRRSSGRELEPLIEQILSVWERR